MRLIPVLGAVGVLAFAGEAYAGPLDACGNIDLTADANCKVFTKGGCDVQCTPINVDLTCNAQLEASCSGGCTVMVDAMCTTMCSGSCMTKIGRAHV